MSAATTPNQLPFDYGLSPSHAAADFIVGDGNVLAHSHVMAWPAWPSPLALVVGPPSSGKSHLARIWAERAGATEAKPDTAEALAAGDSGQPLLIEDADRIPYPETALFNLLNQAMRDDRPLLMTARLPIAEWPYRTDDLKSRVRLAAQFGMRVSDDIQLSQMFAKLFADRQVAVDPRLVAYLVMRMERSPEEAVVLADMLDRMALARGTGITRAIAAEALALRRAERGTSDADSGREGHDDNG